MSFMCRLALLIYWASVLVSPTCCQANGNQPLDVHVDKNSIVRIFYLPPESYLHPALIFRVAGRNDPKLGTAPIDLLGRTPYISFPEMRNLVTFLTDWNLTWQKSNNVATPKKIEPREMSDKMEVKVFSSTGTDRVLLDPKQLCEKLAPLDAALKEPRALWEFQLFRVDYGCHVQGFDRSAYPEHDDPTAAKQR